MYVLCIMRECPLTDKSQLLLQCLNFASVIASGLMVWKGLGLITNTESPIVVVLRCVPFELHLAERTNRHTVDQWNPLSTVEICFS